MQSIRAYLEQNRLSRRLLHDYGYRTALFTFFSLWLNAGLGIVRLVGAWALQSVWYAVIGGYYIVLCGARYLLLHCLAELAGTAQGEVRRRAELLVCRKSGFSMVLLSFAFLCAVIQMVAAGRGFQYPGHLIIPAACAALYKIIFAFLNLRRTRRTGEMLHICIRQLNIADAWVSLVSLQTAIFASIGAQAATYQRTLNAVSGSFVFLLMLGMGLATVHRTNRLLRAPEALQ